VDQNLKKSKIKSLNKNYKTLIITQMEGDLETNFKNLAARVRDEDKIPKDTPDDDMLELYALFKQGSIGDVNIDAPGMFSMPKTKAKFYAWEKKKGMDKKTAMENYIQHAKKLMGE